jgi:hypothetical protein
LNEGLMPMQNEQTDNHVYVALVLAVIAAVASTPHLSQSFQTMLNQPLPSAFPEAANFAAAAGDPLETDTAIPP